ncbi:hypothetical protein ASPZODRAFT_24385 [Penicilliopsis zonata CBS 506.65]|uniref:CFEM domain-containing protein n=1 Tax=Penicilliopsis zonata CBS 506.65 TaxID=1073090 RepID=A0A1L9SK38_9EURO|nr:hypothetical protein ASPZODRAFT_24385 [Penicilliopsis zonata CBS 506.65]OJJ47456.1 hypothetical protein ASPZODRAFT_24385 [Penicilliopsis zonata CBS 506.65]
MKLYQITLAATALLAPVFATSISDLPTCAQSCATNAIPSSCSLIDIKCICESGTFITDIACCVASSCDSADQEKTIEYADELCGSAGVSDLPQSATCATTANSTTTASTSGASGVSSSNTTVSSTTTASGSSSNTAQTASSASTASATSTGGAAPVSMNKEMVIVGVAGVLAALALV